MTAKVTLELSIKDFKSMAEYLERHEGDIAHDCDDFFDIKGLYEAVFEEEPKVSSWPVRYVGDEIKEAAYAAKKD